MFISGHVKTKYVEKNAPFLGAQRLNDFWDAIDLIIDALKSLPIDKGSYNAMGSTSSNYNLTSYRSAAPVTTELPLSFVVVPTITCAAGVTITPSWGTTAYQVYDMSTNAQVSAGVIKESQPTQFLFDGTKFWVNGSGNYLQYSATPTAGYFNRSTTAPTSETRLNYEGILHTKGLYGALFNEKASDLAEGFDVVDDAGPGQLIKINPDGSYVVNDIPMNTKVIGVVSSADQYGVLLGMHYGDTPITMCGRIKAKVCGPIVAGDSLVAAYTPGCLMAKPAGCDPQAVCAMALECNDEEFGEILVLVNRG